MPTEKAGGKLAQVHEFPVAEYQARLRRARALMRKQGLDALLITTETNHRYFTGHWTHRWYNWSRPIISILPLSGSPLVIASSVEIGMARTTAWTRNFKEYLAHDHTIGPVIRAIHEGLSDLELGTGRIGCELGEAQRMGLPVAEFEALRKGVPRAKFVDVSALIWSLRMVKSPREVRHLKESVEITNRVYRDLPKWFRSGMTEEDVYREFVARLFRGGADKEGYVIVNAHLGNVYTGGPISRKIRPGNTFYIDAGCIRRGYWSDYCRYFGLGKVGSAYEDGMKALWDVTQACMEAVGPGREIGAIYAAYERAMDAVKVPAVRAQFGRIGHGIGVDQCEPPSIHKENHVAMKPGMALCIEPNFYLRGCGSFIGEEQVIVTDRGYELISTRAKRGIARVG